jgi:alpha/beta superfamily hydrolase
MSTGPSATVAHAPDPPTASRRVDAATGVGEEVEFFGGEASLFGCRHVPADRPRGAVVICPPLHAEFQTNYRREVALARSLAARGLLVQRFHYRGAGNSAGDDADMTLGTMSEDAAAARARVVDVAGELPTVFLGTRAGAFAAAAAARMTDAALVLWEPMIDPDRYFREMSRAVAMRELKNATAGTRRSLVDELRSGAPVDALGYTIHPALYGSITGQTLDDLLPARPSSAFIVQLGTTTELRRDVRDLAERLRGSGWSITVRPIEATETWWFVNDPAIAGAFSTAVVEATTGWLLEHFDGSSDR